MNANEINAAIAELSAMVGPKAYIAINITGGKSGFHGSFWPNGVGHSGANISLGLHATVEGLIDEMRAKWAEHSAKFEADTIRRLALAVVDLTHLNGDCTHAALRMKFSAEEIKQYGDRACTLAADMATGAPFVIVPTATNGAPSEDALKAA